MAWAPGSMGCNHGGDAISLHFWLCDTLGPPDHTEPTGALLDYGPKVLGHSCEIAFPIFATVVCWIGEPRVHPFRWEVRLQVGSRSLTMGVIMT